MAECQLVSRNGIVKETFESNIDPEDRDAVISLLRKRMKARHLSEATLRVKGKHGWKTFRAK